LFEKKYIFILASEMASPEKFATDKTTTIIVLCPLTGQPALAATSS